MIPLKKKSVLKQIDILCYFSIPNIFKLKIPCKCPDSLLKFTGSFPPLCTLTMLKSLSKIQDRYHMSTTLPSVNPSLENYRKYNLESYYHIINIFFTSNIILNVLIFLCLIEYHFVKHQSL